MSKKPSRAERKQVRAKAARLRADPSGTPAAAKTPPGSEPAQAQPLRAAPVSQRAEAARAASRSRRQAQSTARSEPEEHQADPEPPSEERSALSRFIARLTNRKKRGEHAVLVFLALVMLAAVIVFVAQRGHPTRMVTETSSTPEHAPDKPASPAPDPPAPEPLPPQDDHSPPTIVTAPVKPPPVAASADDRGAAQPAGSVAKPAEPAVAKPAEPAVAKPAEPAVAKPAEPAVAKPTEPKAKTKPAAPPPPNKPPAEPAGDIY